MRKSSLIFYAFLSMVLFWKKDSRASGKEEKENKFKVNCMPLADIAAIFSTLCVFPCYPSVSKSIRTACFRSAFVRFLHFVHTMHKYAACREGLQGRSFLHTAQVCLTSMATNLSDPGSPSARSHIKVKQSAVWISCWDARENVWGWLCKL